MPSVSAEGTQQENDMSSYMYWEENDKGELGIITEQGDAIIYPSRWGENLWNVEVSQQKKVSRMPFYSEKLHGKTNLSLEEAKVWAEKTLNLTQ